MNMDMGTLARIQQIVKHATKGLATKKDLRHFASKKDIEKLVTKEDLKNELKNHPTKEDLKNELKNHPTKEDLKNELDDVVIEVTLRTDKFKVDKETVEELEKRVEKLEAHTV